MMNMSMKILAASVVFCGMQWGANAGKMLEVPEKYMDTIHVTGSVVDAASGERIDNFAVVLPHTWGEDGTKKYAWSPIDRIEVKGANGKIDVKKTLLEEDRFVMIHAEGYEPIVASKAFNTGEDEDGLIEVQVDVQLHKHDTFSGKVLDWNGKAVEGAYAILVEGGARKDEKVATRWEKTARGCRKLIYDAELGDELDSVGDVQWDFNMCYGINADTTDEEGVFHLLTSDKERILFIFTEEGYAEIEGELFKDGDEIRLKKWGKIKGKANYGEKAASFRDFIDFVRVDEKRSGRYEGWKPRVKYDDCFVTYKDGSYESPLLREGDYYVRHETNDPKSNQLYARYITRVQVNGGETLKLNLGGNGCEVKGRLNISGFKIKPSYRVLIRFNRAQLKAGKIVHPEAFASQSFSDQNKWLNGYLKGGKCELKTDYERIDYLQMLTIAAEDDGGFTMSDLPEGEWLMSFSILDPENRMYLVEDYQLPAIAIKKKAGEGNIYKRELEVMQINLHHDERAIEDLLEDKTLELSTIGQKKICLNDYKGKVLLLHNWGTRCAPCRAQMPVLKELVKEFRGTGKFAILGLWGGDDTNSASAYLKEKEVDWDHVMLTANENKLIDALKPVMGVPEYKLVGKDGKVVSMNLPFEELKKAIEEALKK